MYTLYYLPGACSLATQVILRELKQPITLIDKSKVDNFNQLNPAGNVPVLIDGERVLTEGAAILLYLFNKHTTSIMARYNNEHQQGIEDMLFANATMHPAYSKLFFIEQHITNDIAKAEALAEVASDLTKLWAIVENKLSSNRYLGGDTVSAADIMLTVYARWGVYFPVNISIGKATKAMFSLVKALPSFTQSIAAEHGVSQELS